MYFESDSLISCSSPSFIYVMSLFCRLFSPTPLPIFEITLVYSASSSAVRTLFFSSESISKFDMVFKPEGTWFYCLV